MKSLDKLSAVAVPLHLSFTILTASAPPVLRDTLLDNFQACQALLHTMPTHRSDISYSVSRDAVRNMPRAILTHFASLWPKLPDKGQDIVFCNSVSVVELLTEVRTDVAGHQSGDEVEAALRRLTPGHAHHFGSLSWSPLPQSAPIPRTPACEGPRNDFLGLSAFCDCASMYLSRTIPCSAYSCIWGCRMAMCFVLRYSEGFVVSAITPWLSQSRVVIG